MTLSFRKRLQKGDILIGSLLQMPLPEIAESFVQACVVRVPCTDYIMLTRTAAEYLKAVR